MADKIDFSEYERDLFALASDRRLPHLRKGSVRCSVLEAQVTQTQALYSQVPEILRNRTIAEAGGVNLDILGRLVGQARELINQATINWFAPDTVNGAPDNAFAWIEGVPEFGSLPATDDEFRALIESKIFKNHTLHGSAPEVLEFVRLVYDIDISVRRLGNSDIKLIVPASAPQFVITSLTSSRSDVRADNQYFLPISPTVRITETVLKPSVAFAPDTDNGPDVGELSVGIPNG